MIDVGAPRLPWVMPLLCQLSWAVFQSKLSRWWRESQLAAFLHGPCFPQFLPAGSYSPECLPWLPSLMNCVIGKYKPNDPFLSMLFLVMVFFRAMGNKLRYSWDSFLKFYLFLFMCLLLWIFVYHMAQKFKEGVRSFRSRVMGSCEPPCGCWLLTAESHLSRSLFPSFTYYNLSCQHWETWFLPFAVCLLLGSNVYVVIQSEQH